MTVRFMSNNDLWCNKCKSHHHPVDCPLDAAKKRCEPHPEGGKRHLYIYCECDIAQRDKEIASLKEALANKLTEGAISASVAVIKYHATKDLQSALAQKEKECEESEQKARNKEDELLLQDATIKSLESKLSLCVEALEEAIELCMPDWEWDQNPERMKKVKAVLEKVLGKKSNQGDAGGQS